MGELYIVATPIGNLGDTTLRALEVLKNADAIFAEDTRRTKKLLQHFGIPARVFSYSDHSHATMLPKILRLLEDRKDIALVSDAGTPGISDPGRRLVAAVARKGYQAVPIPGPSALAAVISVSDINLSQFSFVGFPPHKKRREKFFRSLASHAAAIILFESPYRLLRLLGDIERFLGERYLNIGRELTKIHEEVFRGPVSGAKKHFAQKGVRGEFVIVIAPSEESQQQRKSTSRKSTSDVDF